MKLDIKNTGLHVVGMPKECNISDLKSGINVGLATCKVYAAHNALNLGVFGGIVSSILGNEDLILDRSNSLHFSNMTTMEFAIRQCNDVYYQKQKV